MKRTKDWWAKLTKEQRSTLVYLERAANKNVSYSAYLPEGYGECPGCGYPTSRSLCSYCSNRLIELINIASQGEV